MAHTDPVCGMQVDAENAITSEHDGQRFYFCSEDCKQQFESNPEQYTRKTA